MRMIRVDVEGTKKIKEEGREREGKQENRRGRGSEGGEKNRWR